MKLNKNTEILVQTTREQQRKVQTETTHPYPIPILIIIHSFLSNKFINIIIKLIINKINFVFCLGEEDAMI